MRDHHAHHHHGHEYGHNGMRSDMQRRVHCARHLLERFCAHLPLHAIGRHHHGGGDGGHGRHSGFGGFGDDDGFTRGRKVTSPDLQLLLLALLAEKPAHGYELIRLLETRSNGFYTPSPGMVYPALTYLEELGHVTVALDGNRKCYALANAGREFLAANRQRADMMLARLAHVARKMDSMRRAYAGEADAESDEKGSVWLPELTKARYALKTALFQRSGASAAEQKRIAAVLLQAARAIAGE